MFIGVEYRMVHRQITLTKVYESLISKNLNKSLKILKNLVHFSLK